MVRGAKIAVDDMIVFVSCSVKGWGNAECMGVYVVEMVDACRIFVRSHEYSSE